MLFWLKANNQNKMPTPFHSQYLAHALTLHPAGNSLERISRSIANARVDLNPHQIDAALFAVRSPLSNGAILADEVGLGKTIEAGIVISQRWAERRRKILLILPATLRKQWQQELQEKFSVPTLILEGSSFNQLKRQGNNNPFEQKDKVIICSYHFASAKAAEMQRVQWDLVVVDEAHRLRNVYKPTNKMANRIADAIRNYPKLLLTATPLQNSLLELYGLVSIIDPHVFGDLDSFRDQFLRGDEDPTRNARLKARIQPICQRTLRKQVLEYIKFTQRIALTEEFVPSDEEHRLYELVSAYLQKEELLALPASQRSLMTLILRKLLASSSYAIAGTLSKLVTRLENLRSLNASDSGKHTETLTAVLAEEIENLDELADEWPDQSNDTNEDDQASPVRASGGAASASNHAIDLELTELQAYAKLAQSIQENAKGSALLRVLETALVKAVNLGAARKAVIFTESRRTQQYLFDLLSQNGYVDQIVMINGTNTDPLSKTIYETWHEQHKGSDRISGSRTADTKAALVEAFRDRATLLLATESAAEGVNLQFASLVVNYDLPWNPQRVEQRIGRCHRYGQKCDVVVVNFLNRRNQADLRVYELLAEKFRLFDGVFGASDEVLGALESGVDIEKRIADVYQNCRTPEEIQTAFDALQSELDEKISAAMQTTRQTLLEHFDEEVHARLRVHKDNTRTALDTRTSQLLALTKTELQAVAEFNLPFVEDDATSPSFTVLDTRGLPPNLREAIQPASRFNLDWKAAQAQDETFFHLEHPLAQWMLELAKDRALEPQELTFDYSKHVASGHARVSIVDQLRGKSGWMTLNKLTVESLELEEFLVFSACTDQGAALDDDLCRKLFGLSHASLGPLSQSRVTPPQPVNATLFSLQTEARQSKLDQVNTKNGKHFDFETEKLDRWAEDLKFALEHELKELDKAIKEAKRTASLASSLTEKLEAQKQLKDQETRRNKKRRELYDAQDAIDAERDKLIAGIEQQLKQKDQMQPIFTVRWVLN